jgi:hypothetical protein
VIYQLRYMFDAGSGVCLWSENTPAQSEFGYAVEHWELPLSENSKRYLDYLISWFDISIDWANPAAAGSFWGAEQQALFTLATDKGLQLLRQELGHGFEVISAL